MNRNLDMILGRLSKLRGRNGAWTACCPAHKDRSPSLAIRETEDGRILLHCFAGCAVDAICGALGVQLQDLFPERPVDHAPPERRRFYAADLLRVMEFEATVVMVAAAEMASGRPLPQTDRERLALAQQRISEALVASQGHSRG